jgi:hypothetical protein
LTPAPLPRIGGRVASVRGAPGLPGFFSLIVAMCDWSTRERCYAPTPNISRSAPRYCTWPTPLVL